MFIEGKAILHIVDTATRFSSAIFLDSQGNNYGQSINGVWLAFIEAWCNLYTGLPNRIRTDAGSVFTSPRWKEMAESGGIELRISGVESHNSLGIGERLHAPLRRIFRKIVSGKPNNKNETSTVNECDSLSPGPAGYLLLFLSSILRHRCPVDVPCQRAQLDGGSGGANIHRNCSAVTLPTVRLVTAVPGPPSPPSTRVSHVSAFKVCTLWVISHVCTRIYTWRARVCTVRDSTQNVRERFG